MTLPTPAMTLTTTEAPNSTHGDTGDNGLHPHAGVELDWAVWAILVGSLLCLSSAVLGYVVLVWLPRRG